MGKTLAASVTIVGLVGLVVLAGLGGLSCDNPDSEPSAPAPGPSAQATGLKFVAQGTGVPDDLKKALEAHLAENLHRKDESWFGFREGDTGQLEEFRFTSVEVFGPVELEEADRLNGIQECRLAWLVGSRRFYIKGNSDGWSQWNKYSGQGLSCNRVGGVWTVNKGLGSLDSYEPCSDPDEWVAQASGRGTRPSAVTAPATLPAAP